MKTRLIIPLLLTIIIWNSSCKNSDSSESNDTNTSSSSSLSEEDKQPSITPSVSIRNNKNDGTEEDEDNSEDESSKSSEETSYNGSYTATVEYYNPKTGTHSTYSLPVQVESNELEEIDFPNGGYLGQYHYVGGDELEDGTVTITSDEGAEYTVTLDN